jgi:hypothetical protein
VLEIKASRKTVVAIGGLFDDARVPYTKTEASTYWMVTAEPDLPSMT